MKYKDKVVVVLDEVIAQIRVAPTDTMGWVEEGLRKAWLSMFPLTQISLQTGYLNLDHPAWGLVSNKWWNFITDAPLILWEEVERLSRQ